MKTKILILGAGGHTKVLLDTLLSREDISILGILDINPKLKNKEILNIRVIGSEAEMLGDYSPFAVKLINGIGSTEMPIHRKIIFNKLTSQGYKFLSVIHPSAYIAKNVKQGEGCQLMAGSIIQPDCTIGNNAIINTRVTVEHDCQIENHVHLAPGVVCCGSVSIGECSHIGTGAVIKQGIRIGHHCLVAAGAVVVKDVPNETKVAGVPAKVME